MGVTERPSVLNPSKATAMAICPIIVHFSTWCARSMHNVACEFARAAVRSKDAQKQLARTSLNHAGSPCKPVTNLYPLANINQCLFDKSNEEKQLDDSEIS